MLLQQKRKTKAPFSMEERSEDVDFIFASETYSDDEPIVSPRSRISNATVAQSTKSAQLTDEEANQPSYFSVKAETTLEITHQNKVT